MKTPKAMKHLGTFLFTFLVLASSAFASMPITWDDLRDPKAAQFDDPFAALSGPELRGLGTVLQLRQQLDGTDVGSDARPAIEQRLRQEEAKLAAAGIATDKLLSRRFEIGKKRAAAALAGNPALAGKEIAITGYVIPVQEPGSEDVSTGYLVPDQGMCSHMPAPDPNQMIRYRLQADWRPDHVYEPVLLIGRLSLKTTKQEITLLDGQVDMIAAFELEVRQARSLNDETSPNPANRIWRFFTRPGAQGQHPAQ